jgi:cytochrome c oxidase assembly protein subunit 15
MTEDLALARFRRIGLITICAVYFLIMVGSTVRASGAGMGCPDWPTCFGQLIPPTDESQLPPNYHEIYAVGYADTHFNPLKTWTEYLNRLVGVGIGVLITLTLAASVPFLKKDKNVFWLCLGVFFAIGFQAWLGSAVVASNLKPAMITAHMLMALLIVATLIYAVTRAHWEPLAALDSRILPERVYTVARLVIFLTVLQIVLGIQVREAVDVIDAALQHENRPLWREQFPVIFYVHRSFSIVVLAVNGWLAWTLHRNLGKNHLLARTGRGLIGLIVCAIILGISMDRLGMPAFAQPLHLLMASLIFGAQFFLFTAYRYSRDGSDQRGLARGSASL